LKSIVGKLDSFSEICVPNVSLKNENPATVRCSGVYRDSYRTTNMKTHANEMQG